LLSGYTAKVVDFLFIALPLRAIPKKDGTTQIIWDLSSPHGTSEKEDILSELLYCKVFFFWRCCF